MVNGLSARAALTRTEMTLRALNGSINGGSLAGSGTVSYQPDAGLNAHLAADVRDMALEFPRGCEASLTRCCSSTRLPSRTPRRRRANSRERSRSCVARTASRWPLSADCWPRCAPAASRATGAPSSEDTAFLKQLALDIRVQTDEDLIVDNNYARAQLGADLNLIGTRRGTRDVGTRRAAR